jgi:hypothetical protein
MFTTIIRDDGPLVIGILGLSHRMLHGEVDFLELHSVFNRDGDASSVLIPTLDCRRACHLQNVAVDRGTINAICQVVAQAVLGVWTPYLPACQRMACSLSFAVYCNSQQTIVLNNVVS